MLQTADGPGRRFRTAPLAHPYGRGEEVTTEQFVVADEDGYLLRFFTDRP
jgi:hypothetical protein